MGYDDSHMVVRDNWVNVTCPLARLRHSSGQDSHASAGISINPTGNSVFKCFSCTPTPVKLLSLIVQKSMENGYKDTSLTRYYQAHEISALNEDEREDAELFEDEAIEGTLKFNRWVVPKISEQKQKEEIPPIFPLHLLKNFPLVVENNDSVAMNIKDYLVSVRGISLSTIADMGIRYNKQRNLIIFPLTDINGDIQVLRARVCDVDNKIMFTISPKQFGNKYALPTIRDSGACFGLNKITASKPVIIVESETDCLLLKTYGFNNVIATTSASFSKTQIYNIPSPNLWVGFDNDEAGRRATKKLIEVSNGKLVHVINWENAGGKDPGDAENRLDIVRALNKKILVDKKVRHGKYF